MIPVDSLGHHLFDLDHVTIRVSLKRLRLPEGPRISESHPICAMMCLAGEIKRIITRQSTFTEDLYFEKVDPNLILQSQVSLSFLRHPFEAPSCIVAQVKPEGLRELLSKGTDEARCVGVTKMKLRVVSKKDTIKRTGRIYVHVETHVREIHAEDLDVIVDGDEEGKEDTEMLSENSTENSTEGCVIEMKLIVKDVDSVIHLNSILACDVTLEDGVKLVRTRSLLVIRNRLNWSLDLKFCNEFNNDENTRLLPSMSKYVPFTYLSRASSVRVRPSESDGVKFDWAKDFQCGKLLNMILQEDDIHLGNFDDPCDLKHLRFDSLDDDDHTLWIFAMLSRTRNGTRVLSFHHVLRVQNLLPITLRLTVRGVLLTCNKITKI